MAIATSQLSEAFFQTASRAFQVQISLPLVGLIWAINLLMAAAVLVAARQSRRINSLALKLNTRHIVANSWLASIATGQLERRFG